MYFLSDSPAAIREVQKFLYVISYRVNSDVPRVAIDGIYGPETEAAVIAFQEIYGHSASGSVDRETFDSLYTLSFFLDKHCICRHKCDSSDMPRIHSA